MEGKPLTPKQEKFAQVYVETGNASEAYRRAYDTKNYKPESVTVNASKLLASANVSQRVNELKAELVKRHEITVDTIRDMLLEDRNFARDLENPSTAVTATQALGKLYGMFTDKHEHSGGVTVQILRLGDE